jgi:hydroxymethylpyrimidine/phosphomethylpyrimidine kinase
VTRTSRPAYSPRPPAGTPRREGERLHGTGRVLSAAITAGLVRGSDLAEAVAEAKRHVTRAIEAAPAE